MEDQDSARALGKSVLHHHGDGRLVVELVVQPTPQIEQRLEIISKVLIHEGMKAVK